MLPEFMTACRITDRPPAEDELIRGLRTMFETKEVTLSLAFAATLFLDIHHTLREQVDVGFQSLVRAATFAQNNINNNLECHKALRIDTWPKENDDAMKQFVDFIKQWILHDPQRQAARQMKRLNIPEPFYLLRQHPWSCGLWKYYIQIRLHEIGITFVNAWGSVMSCAHLYNAIQGEKMLTHEWKDMDVAVSLQGVSNFFVGEPPNSPDDYLKQFAMAMGVSATNLGKKNRKKKGLAVSKRGPHSLKELGSLLQTFRGRYCEMNGRFDLRTEDVEKIVQNCKWEYEMDEDNRPTELFKDTDTAPGSKKGLDKQLPVAKLLGLLRAMLHAEIIEISFDFLTLHRQCWRLLRFLRDVCRDRLVKMYGPEYIEKETQLPFIVGYILMAATSTKQLGDLLKIKKTTEVTSAVLADAARVVEGLVGSEAGELVVGHVLPEMLGVEVEFQTEPE